MRFRLNIIACTFLFVSLISCRNFIEPEENSRGAKLFRNQKAYSTRSENTLDYFGHKYIASYGPLSIDDARVIFSDLSLQPTHRAISFIPESMDQLQKLEANQSLIIFYHPFDYVLLPDPNDWETEEAGEAQVDFTKDDCGINEPDSDSIVLCPIYVLWPISDPIPSNLSYIYYYDAYVSTYTINNRELPDPQPVPGVFGYLRSNDNRFGYGTPIRNVQLEYQDDSGFTQVSSSDNNGYFFLPFADPNSLCVINLKNDEFFIREGMTSNIKSLSFYLSDYSMSIENNEYDVYLPTSFYLDVYKAADYYFHGSNNLLNSVIRYDTLGVSINIRTFDSSGPNGGAGYFDHDPTFIKIWNNYKNNYVGASSKIFGHVLHELGHATHYVTVGATNMDSTDNMISESFALFFGWYNVWQYYFSLTGNNHFLVNTICTEGRQQWVPYSPPDIYSPLFVDLFDMFNQNLANSLYNYDPISGVPLSFILSCSLGPLNFQSVYNSLASGVGTYYSSSQFSSFIAPYSVFLP